MGSTPEVCRKCAGKGLVDKYDPVTKKIETVECPNCGGTGVTDRWV